MDNPVEPAYPVEGVALLTPVLRLLLRTLERAEERGQPLNPNEVGYLKWLRTLRAEDAERQEQGYQDGWASATIVANPPNTGGHSEHFYARHRDTYVAAMEAEFKAGTDKEYAPDPYLVGYGEGADAKAQELGYGQDKPVD